MEKTDTPRTGPRSESQLPTEAPTPVPLELASPGASVQDEDMDEKSGEGLLGILVAYADHDREIRTLLGDDAIASLSDVIVDVVTGEDIDQTHVIQMIKHIMKEELGIIERCANLTSYPVRYECMISRVMAKIGTVTEVSECMRLCDCIDDMFSDVFSQIGDKSDEEIRAVIVAP